MRRQNRTTLTNQEQAIAILLAGTDAPCNKEIARVLGIGEKTVKAHLTNIYRKLGCSGRLALANLMNHAQVAV